MSNATVLHSPIPWKRCLESTLLSVVLLLESAPVFSTSVSSGLQTPTVIAQVFPDSPPGCTATGCRLTLDQIRLRPGDVLPARYSGEERQIIQTGETRSITLDLAASIRDRNGRVLVPQNSQIEGEIVPVEGGGQFLADRLIINGRAYDLAAESDILHDVKDPNQTSVQAIATDAAIGAAGAVAIGKVLGKRRISTAQVLGGAAAGVAIGNVTAPRAVVIKPGQVIPLAVTRDFQL